MVFYHIKVLIIHVSSTEVYVACGMYIPILPQIICPEDGGGMSPKMLVTTF
jgi:hypothetical protein